jgi:hypothetical protein
MNDVGFSHGTQLIPSLSGYVAQLTFVHNALVRLIDAPYSILGVTIALRQLFGDNISAAREVLAKRALDKHSLTNTEFVGLHGLPLRKKLVLVAFCLVLKGHDFGHPETRCHFV